MVLLVHREDVLAASLTAATLVVVTGGPAGAAAYQLALARVATAVCAARRFAVVDSLTARRRRGVVGTGPAFLPLCDLRRS